MKKLPQDRTEAEQKEHQRLQRFQDGLTNAVPVMQYERGDLP